MLTPEQSPSRHDHVDAGKALKSLRLSRIILPVLLGLSSVVYLFYRQFDLEQFQAIRWSGHAFFWIALAFLLLLVRHLFYALRMRTITLDLFSWRKCIQLIVLWEFSAALTPTSKGGPLVMMFVLTQEKLSAGRTAAAVFYTMVCDAGFFVICLPIFLSLYGPIMLYPGMKNYSDVGLASGTFFVTYAIISTYWLFLMFFLFFKPTLTRGALLWLSRRRILRRFKNGIERLGEEFGLAAREMHDQKFQYHLKVILATLGAWTSKFLMINCLIIALVPSTPIDGGTQLFIYARLVAMFTIMSFSPTPGGAGLAEIALTSFISDYVPQSTGMMVALLWRGMAYYGYLIAGAFVVPAWITSKITGKHHK